MTSDTPQSEALSAKTEADLLSRVRAQYLAEGYEAFARLPIEEDDPLSAYRPDLVLRKGSEVIVVEVKRSNETRDMGDLRSLRTRIESHPGWHFRLLFVGNPFQAPPMTVRSDLKATSETARRISNARSLFDRGDYAGAITFLWIAVEAALRSYFAKSGELPTSAVTALSMLRRLHEEGVVSETEYNLLTKSYQLRNNAVHGFDVQLKKPSAERMLKIGEALIERLRKVARGND